MTRASSSERGRAIIAALFVACAMVLGGGGSPNPATEIVLQEICVVAALAWLWLPGEAPGLSFTGVRRAWVLAALAVAVPAIQLLPLPPVVWHSLSGQGDRLAALSLVGAAQSWQPLTLSPPHTLASLLALAPPLFAFLATASLSARRRQSIIGVIALVGLAAAVFGGLQVSLGSAAPRLYAESNNTLTAFQANKNAAADLLLIGMAALATTLAPSLAGAVRASSGTILMADRRAAWLAFSGGMAVLAIAVVFTNSRAGTVLIAVALAGCWIIVSSARRRGARLSWAFIAAVGIAVAGFALAPVALGSHALGPMFARFAAPDDFRRELWRDAWFALQRSWPNGIGLGDGQAALMAAERLDIVAPPVPNRVHNDYLEFILEGGLAAVAVLLLGAGLVAGTAWRAWRERAADRPQTALGVTIVLIVGCHSLVDYPLRSMALACLTGVGVGLLFAPPTPGGRAARRQATA